MSNEFYGVDAQAFLEAMGHVNMAMDESVIIDTITGIDGTVVNLERERRMLRHAAEKLWYYEAKPFGLNANDYHEPVFERLDGELGVYAIEFLNKNDTNLSVVFDSVVIDLRKGEDKLLEFRGPELRGRPHMNPTVIMNIPDKVE